MTATFLIITMFALVADVKAATKYPVSSEARRWHPDRDWLRGAFCVHSGWLRGTKVGSGEAADWHIRNSPYSGGLQFTLGTWQRVGGRGEAADWAPREQFYRAWLVWRQDGGSWREWPTTSRACGLA